ncbi:MAG: hypothetical protein ACRCUI_01120 [Polymorphobacter sp.]
MQRVRVGLTGLAAIFLLVVIAAAGLKPAARIVQPQGQGETLAVLGVAPSSGSEFKTADPQPAPPAKAPTRPSRT